MTEETCQWGSEMEREIYRARGRGEIARVELLDQLERIGPSTTGLHESMDSLSINQNEWKNRPFLGQVAGLISYYRSVWISSGCLQFLNEISEASIKVDKEESFRDLKTQKKKVVNKQGKREKGQGISDGIQ